jgi:hypothetical protein
VDAGVRTVEGTSDGANAKDDLPLPQ